MTGKDLEKEAEDYANKKAEKLNVPRDSQLLPYMRVAYLAGAKPREKRITEAKGIIKDILSLGVFGIFKGTTSEEIVNKAEDFIKG